MTLHPAAAELETKPYNLQFALVGFDKLLEFRVWGCWVCGNYWQGESLLMLLEASVVGAMQLSTEECFK